MGSLKSQPNFLIVGSPKCGSSTLAEILGRHPQIYFTDPKEPRYFSKGIYEVERTWDWYLDLFKDVENEIAIGEGTVGYTVDYPRFWADPRTVHDRLPEAKIIYIVRHPLERIMSHFVNTKVIGYPSDMGPFKEAVRNHPMLVETTKYWKHISSYLDLFGSKNVKILFFEDMKSGPMSFFNEVFSFLGVDENYKVEELSHANPSGARHMDSNITHLIRKHVNLKRVKSLLPASVIALSRHIFKSKFRKPTWDKNSKEFVRKTLNDDSVELLRFCGKPTTFWEY